MALRALLFGFFACYGRRLALGRIERALELNCDFEQFCPGWLNGTLSEDHVDWHTTSSLVIDAWHSIPRSFQGQQFTYAVGTGQLSPQSAWLVSDVVPCLITPGYLTFYFWKNSFLSGIFSNFNLPSLGDTPRLIVGIRKPPSSTNLRVLHIVPANNQWGWKAAAVEIPESEGPFQYKYVENVVQIIIEAYVQNAFDVIGIDDIFFRGIIGEGLCKLGPEERQSLLTNTLLQPPRKSPFGGKSDTRKAAEQDKFPFFEWGLGLNPSFGLGPNPSFVLGSALNTTGRTGQLPTTVAKKSSAEIDANGLRHRQTSTPTENCTAVDCDFEGDSCAYEGTDNDNGAWVIMQGKIGNPLTGIPHAAFGSYYAVSYSSNATVTQLLRSKGFRTVQPTTLTFWYYFANAITGRLRLCDVTFDNCPWEVDHTTVGNSARQWRLASVALPPGKHRLYFAAEQLQSHYYAALDRIAMREDGSGPEFAQCEVLEEI